MKLTGSDTQKVLDAEAKGPHGEALSLVSRNTVVPGQKLLRMWKPRSHSSKGVLLGSQRLQHHEAAGRKTSSGRASRGGPGRSRCRPLGGRDRGPS